MGSALFILQKPLKYFTGADSCSGARIGGMKVILFEEFARTEQGDFTRDSPKLVELIQQYQKCEAEKRAELEKTEVQRLKAQRPEVGLGAWMTPHPVKGVPGCGIAQGLRDQTMAEGMK